MKRHFRGMFRAPQPNSLGNNNAYINIIGRNKKANYALRPLQCADCMDTPSIRVYSKEPMFQRLTTIMLLTALTVQAVFGGLQDSVSICLGGGHEHDVAEVVEHCEMECSHHSEWPTPLSEGDDIDDCECTDVELTLVTLLSVPRDSDDAPCNSLSFLPTPDARAIVQTKVMDNSKFVDPPPERQQLQIVRITRLLV